MFHCLCALGKLNFIQSAGSQADLNFTHQLFVLSHELKVKVSQHSSTGGCEQSETAVIKTKWQIS